MKNDSKMALDLGIFSVPMPSFFNSCFRCGFCFRHCCSKNKFRYPLAYMHVPVMTSSASSNELRCDLLNVSTCKAR